MAFHSNEVVTVTDSVTGITVPAGYPSSAIFVVQDAPIRVTLHGEDPDNSAKNGITLAEGTVFEVTGTRDLNNLRMLRTTSVSSAVSVNYQQKD